MNNNINNRGISMDINFNQKNEINTTDRNKLNYKKIIVNKKLSIPFNHKAETNRLIKYQNYKINYINIIKQKIIYPNQMEIILIYL